MYVCVHTRVCAHMCVLCLRKSGPAPCLGARQTGVQILALLHTYWGTSGRSFPFAVPCGKRSWLEHLALKFWKPWGSLNEGSSRAGSHNCGVGESPYPKGPVRRAKAPLPSLGIRADYRAMGLREGRPGRRWGGQKLSSVLKETVPQQHLSQPQTRSCQVTWL